MCVCMYVCVCTCMHVGMCVFCVCTWTCMYLYMCVCACMHIPYRRKFSRYEEYHLEPIIKQFNTPTLHISVRIHKICLGICPKILSSLCTATASTSFLFPCSLMQVKVSPGVAFHKCLYTGDIQEHNYRE